MPSIYVTPAALAKVAFVGGAIDPLHTALYGCTVVRTPLGVAAGDFLVKLTQPIGPNEISVQVTAMHTDTAGDLTDVFVAKVVALPGAGNTPPDTWIQIYFLGGADGVNADPTAFFVRVDRVRVGS